MDDVEDPRGSPTLVQGCNTTNTDSPPAVQSPNINGAHEPPRTVGGFVMEDDEDEEAYTPMLSDQQDNGNVTATEQMVDVDQGSPDGQRLETVSQSNDKPTTPDPASSSVAQDQDEPVVATGDQAESAFHVAPFSSTNGVSAEKSPVAENPHLLSSAVQTSAAPASDEAALSSVSKARLPHDHVGLLEDRIKEDPRGDLDAWLGLIAEHKRRNKLDDARNVYERFFKTFPCAAEQWVSWANMELENNDFYRVEQIFNQSLLNVPNVHLWSSYLNYVRRRNNITHDKAGNARKVVTEAYEFVLSTIGQDKDSGAIWQDYVQFIRNSPEQIGGTSWQEQQKMDTLRKVYQRAICIPTQAVQSLWKDYDAFETGLNKQTGRKFLQEKSVSYMTARGANAALQGLTRDLKRTTLPVLPPALGFEGDVEYMTQVELWKRWIEWEKDDPLVLKEEDPITFRNRILYVYKQALMALRFWPEMWFDAAEFCFGAGLDTEGNDFLTQGIAANPESCLLAFKKADRIEATTTKEDNEESIIQRGAAVREAYDKVLDALYELCSNVKEREAAAVKRLQDAAPPVEPADENKSIDGDDEEAPRPISRDAAPEVQVGAIQKGLGIQLKILGKTITFAWIALLRAMRRVQGKGKLGAPVGGSRQIFGDSRKRGRLTSDFYVANALIEFHCYQDPVATKVFERGVKLFPEEGHIALEYIKHLVATNDTTNARAVFETTVTRLAQKPHLIPKSKPLFHYFHEFESHYGELSQIAKLEARMRDLFPEDPQLRLFAQRFSGPEFDPTAIRHIISPASQARPKGQPLLMPAKEKPASVTDSPKPSITSLPVPTLSPKRPYEESDNESSLPRKIARSDSPLKGAAGRRLLDAAARKGQFRQELLMNGSHSSTPPVVGPPPPTTHVAAPLPPGIQHILGILPRAESYHAVTFRPQGIMDLLRNADLSRATRRQPQQVPPPHLAGQYFQSTNPNFGYGG